LLLGLTAIEFRAESGTILCETFLRTSAGSGTQLDLVDRARRCPSEDPSLMNVFSTAEDSLKRRVTRSKAFYLIPRQRVNTKVATTSRRFKLDKSSQLFVCPPFRHREAANRAALEGTEREIREQHRAEKGRSLATIHG
jgi:hypothetical protein